MENKKMRPGLLITFAGALLAYLIGSGTASGQESVQYFSSWGSVGGTITVAVVNFVVMFCCFMATPMPDATERQTLPVCVNSIAERSSARYSLLSHGYLMHAASSL